MPSDDATRRDSRQQRDVRRVIVALNYRQYLAYLRETGIDPNLCRYITHPYQLRGVQLGPELQLVRLPDWWQRYDHSEMADAIRSLESTSA